MAVRLKLIREVHEESETRIASRGAARRKALSPKAKTGAKKTAARPSRWSKKKCPGPRETGAGIDDR
jgi:hypothetical protein